MTLAEVKHRLRQRSEYSLRLAAMSDVARRYPGRTSSPALPQAGPFWRYVFVPLFRRVPWSYKQKAMRGLKMTAQGWAQNAPAFGQPWRPPGGGVAVGARDPVRPQGDGSAGKAAGSQAPQEVRVAED